MKSISCILLGFGSAAHAFMDILSRREDYLKERYRLRVEFTGAMTRNHGSFIVSPGLQAGRVLEEYRNSSGFFGLRQFPGDALGLIRSCPADIVFEMTPLNPFTGQPALDHVVTALESGKHVISANKGPVAFGLKRLKQASRQSGKAFLYETAVMDGAPVFNLVERCLPGCKILGFEGVLNSTTNFILDELMKGSDFSAALETARELGFAEADPSMDTEGWDPACKTAALMNAWMDAEITPGEISRQGISQVDGRLLDGVKARGNRLRLICRAAYREGIPEGAVVLAEVPAGSNLAGVAGTTSLLRISTDLMGDISIIEHEPAIEQTGYGLYSDLLRLLEDMTLPSLGLSPHDRSL